MRKEVTYLTHHECDLRSEPLKEVLTKVENKVDKIYIVVIIAMVGFCGNLLLTFLNKSIQVAFFR